MSIPINVGDADRMVRGMAALLLMTLNLLGIVTGWLSVAAWVVTAVLLLTAMAGYCPLYSLLGINTSGARPTPRA
ncbi:MAG TPA: DUF2892 domain-containing protein [Longimicrobium sp.]|nr:DUF2892 domain-containing protein [Longimicrobium sp.]